MKIEGIEIKKNKVLSLLLVLSISIGSIVYHFRHLDVNSTIKNLEHVRISWLMLGLVVMAAYWFMEALVLYKMTRKVHPEQTLWESIKVTMIGQFFNTITPFASGGQPAQLFVMVKNKISVEVGGSVLLIKFILFQAMLVLSSIVVLLFGYNFLEDQSIPQLRTLIIIGFLVNTVVITVLITIAKSKRVAFFLARSILKPASFFIKKERYERWKVKLDHKMITFHEESNRMGFDWKLLLQCSILTMVQLWLFFSIPFFIIHGVGIAQVNLFQVIAFHSFIMMFSSLVPIPGGSGGAEYSFSLLFGLILTPTRLILCLIFWRFITYYSCIIVGSFFLFTKKRQDRNLQAG